MKKAYQKPEVEMVSLITERIAAEVGGGVAGGEPTTESNPWA